MNYYYEFDRMMTEQGEFALATSMNNAPNVRIMNFFYDIKRRGVLFFATFRDNPKVSEFAQNSNVAFTTVAIIGSEHVRVKDAIVRKSNMTIFDLRDEFCEKIPDYRETIDQVGDMLDLYEIHFNKAMVTIDMERIGEVKLN